MVKNQLVFTEMSWYRQNNTISFLEEELITIVEDRAAIADSF
jgi:hypothetical protein